MNSCSTPPLFTSVNSTGTPVCRVMALGVNLKSVIVTLTFCTFAAAVAPVVSAAARPAMTPRMANRFIFPTSTRRYTSVTRRRLHPAGVSEGPHHQGNPNAIGSQAEQDHRHLVLDQKGGGAGQSQEGHDVREMMQTAGHHRRGGSGRAPGGHRRGPAVAADHPADVLIEPHLRAEPRGHQGDEEGIEAPLVEQVGEGPGREGDDQAVGEPQGRGPAHADDPGPPPARPGADCCHAYGAHWNLRMGIPATVLINSSTGNGGWILGKISTPDR